MPNPLVEIQWQQLFRDLRIVLGPLHDDGHDEVVVVDEEEQLLLPCVELAGKPQRQPFNLLLKFCKTNPSQAHKSQSFQRYLKFNLNLNHTGKCSSNQIIFSLQIY